MVSVISGHLLVRWCPEGIGPRLAAGQVSYWDSPAAMWLLLSVIGLVGCFGAVALPGWLPEGLKEAPAEPGAAG